MIPPVQGPRGQDALPAAAGLDVGALSRFFDDTTTSYKHLLFRAILDALPPGGGPAILELGDLAVGMLVAAWHPARVYRLSLGVRDQVAELLAGIDLGGDGPISARRLKEELVARSPDCRALMRFVPFRLIAPFFSEALRGVPDHRRNGAVRALASERFADLRPLYRFLDGGRIEVHPAWVDYLAANMPIVSAWAERRWIAYLQSRNPAVPAVSEKTSAPPRRDSLAAQTRYWRRVAEAAPEGLLCIYSGRPVAPGAFQLDHFLPWTFTCHDALWNLVPVSPEANASKGNRLPDRAYLEPMAAVQHLGLVTARRIMADRDWNMATVPFLGDLRVPEASLLDPAALGDAYRGMVGAQLDIARGIGFEPGWRFSSDR